MRFTKVLAAFAAMGVLLPAVVIGGRLAGPVPDGRADAPERPATNPASRPADAGPGPYAPYSPDPGHLWNRLHQALFVREAPNGGRHVDLTDPLLYPGSTFLLEGESHRQALALLDEFLAAPGGQPAGPPVDDPLKRLVFQRDLWAAFDYMAWYPDDWVHHSRHEPAAVALRTRLARAVGRLALTDHELDALPDNYALAVASKQYPAAHDPAHPERPFLPADLFDPAGPWVRFQDGGPGPMTQKHFDAAGGRAVHVVFLRLPDGRAATEQYLKDLSAGPVTQFPPGTMLAMVRRALAVDRAAKVRVTPVTELVQVRVYRRIPADPRANFHGDFGAQDVCEFVLDRTSLFAGQPGLRATDPHDPEEPFERPESSDPFQPGARADGARMRQLKSCIQCHQAPGIHSVLSMQRGLHGPPADGFRTFAWNVETGATVKAKVRRYDWGMLQGMLDVEREGARQGRNDPR